ncbi:unnamed protein product, partial [Brenthis ino]
MLLRCLYAALFICTVTSQVRRLGKFKEVFAWKQMTYDINGNILLQDRFGEDFEGRERRSADNIVFENDPDDVRDWNLLRPPNDNAKPSDPSIPDPTDETGRFFVQYNNLPMGVERVGGKLFITVPRRRHGIPSTLNYINLKEANSRSPSLKPYPNIRDARSLTSVYRTRADECGRLWMVDTGLLEIPDNPQQVQQPAIVIFDLNRNRQIMRYPLKNSDLPAANTPTGLASITIDINGDCGDAYAYVPDLTTFGIIVYSLKDNNSWRHNHVYFHFNPTASNLHIAGQTFQWSDGIFSITLTEPGYDGCRTAYFHPMISTQEFSISTCVLKNNTISSNSNYFSYYSIVGERGVNSQSTMHAFDTKTRVVFFAEIGRDAISCWNSGRMLNPTNVAILANDSVRMSYPADLHITDDEVWVLTNTLPRFGYSKLDTNEYNFYVYRGKVQELVAGTVCSPTFYG